MPSTNSYSSEGRRTKRRGFSTKRHRKGMRGGTGNAPSAHSFVQGTVGNGNQQWDNTFIRGGPFGGSIQNLDGTQPSVVAGAFPSPGQLNLIQRGAGYRRHMGGKNSSSSSSSSGGKRTKRGGYWGKVISQALVPFSLLFAQNRFGTRKHQGKK